MTYNINILLEKYWAAEASLQEEAQLRAYFASDDLAPEHQVFTAVFAHINEQRSMSTAVNVENILTQIEHTNDIDSLLTKYFEAQTNESEEDTLKAYFTSDVVKEQHAEFIPLFAFFDNAGQASCDLDIESILTQNNGDSSIDILIEKYHNTDTTLEEENVLRAYFNSDNVAPEHLALQPLFAFFENQKSISSSVEIEEVLNQEGGHRISDTQKAPREAKVFSLRKALTAVAAVFVLGFAAYSVMNVSNDEPTKYKGKFVQLDEEAETEEALEITMEALAFLSKKMNKNSKTVVKSVSKADAASIFK